VCACACVCACICGHREAETIVLRLSVSFSSSFNHIYYAASAVVRHFPSRKIAVVIAYEGSSLFAFSCENCGHDLCDFPFIRIDSFLLCDTVGYADSDVSDHALWPISLSYSVFGSWRRPFRLLLSASTSLISSGPASLRRFV